MKPLLDTEKLQGGVFKLKLVPENMKFEALEITKTSVLSEGESDVSSMNFSGVSVEEPTPTTTMSNRKPLSQVKWPRSKVIRTQTLFQIQSQVLKSQKRKLQLSPMANEGSPTHKSPVGIQKQPIQASTPLVNENRFFNQSIHEG